MSCDPCAAEWSVKVDNVGVYGIGGGLLGDCPGSFSVDLTSLNCTGCHVITAVGVHTVQVTGESLCGNTFVCLQLQYEVVASCADPWANDVDVDPGQGGLDSVTIRFEPASSCGLPECNEVCLIQSVRFLGIAGDDTSCVSLQDVGFAPGLVDTLQTTVTPMPQCMSIDWLPGDFDPCLNGRDKTDRGGRGRIGSNPAPSTTWDKPNLKVPPGKGKLLAEFEVNAYCMAGKSKGRYLGKTFYTYERTSGAATGTLAKDPRRAPDLGGPTSAFLSADSLYRKEKGFPSKPKAPPATGGIPCQ